MIVILYEKYFDVRCFTCRIISCLYYGTSFYTPLCTSTIKKFIISLLTLLLPVVLRTLRFFHYFVIEVLCSFFFCLHLYIFSLLAFRFCVFLSLVCLFSCFRSFVRSFLSPPFVLFCNIFVHFTPAFFPNIFFFSIFFCNA